MSDPLSILGKSLAEEFRQNLSQWLPAESTFGAEEVFGSLESSEGIVQVEEQWNDLSSINPSSETDFIPQDLVEGFFVKTVPEQSSETSSTEGKRESRAIPSSTKGNFPSNSSFEKTEIQQQQSFFQNNDVLKEASKDHQSSSSKEKKSSDSLIRNDEGNFSKNSGQFSENEQSFFDDEGSFLKNESSSPSKNDLNNLDENEGDENVNRPAFSKRKNESLQTSKQNPAAQPTQFNNEVSKSIWSAPLHNLSDFAGMVSYVAPDKIDQSKPTQDSAKPSIDNGEKPRLANAPIENGNNFQDGWFVIPDSANAQNVLNLPASTIQQAQPIPMAANGTRAENRSFPNPQQQQVSSPDPDELLEALTERILRDFRRYYP
jgi:hypothetical protein